MVSPFLGRFFLVSKRTIFGFFFMGITNLQGQASWPWPSFFHPGQLTIEFANVGGWLTSGDLALDSCAQFLAVAEFRLIPSRARSVCHQLRKAGHHSIWALVKIKLLVVILLVPPLLFPPLLLLSLRSFSGKVVF